MKQLCVIFGAGDTFAPRKKFGDCDIIIAADGGYKNAVKYGLEPNVVIGDFDSGDMPENTSAHVVKLNRDKDETDTLAAVKLGLRRGCDTFAIYGGVGGRLDHTVANFSALKYLNAFGARGFLVDETSVATVITDDKFTLPKAARGIVSVFAYGGEARGVTLKNLKYKLDNVELTPDFPVGVSNETTGAAAEISVKNGSLLIFFPRF
ncbi:MAG: thiamine diphosphokinase [Roseburia sp.]|nr:thiamine diphosphokinase [Roseburia sp.]